MQIQINTSNGIENSESLEAWARDYLQQALERFSPDISRLEVQLADESKGRKGAADLRCMMEVRLNGREPLAATHHASTQDEAFRGAAQRLVHLLDHTLGKLDRHQHRDRDTIRKDASPIDS
ncbi:MAG: HPF/RaiA family ribosome-associated protein [Ramlibacter sp.]